MTDDAEPRPTGDDLMVAVVENLRRRRPEQGPFIIAITGSVSVGKSVFSKALKARLEAWPATVELAATDGFLRPNAQLDAEGLATEKGFPVSYDTAALRAALADADAELLSKIERGEESVVVAGFELAPGEVKVVRKFAPSAEAIASMPPGAAVDGAGGDAGTGDALFVALDLSLDEDLLAEGTAREVASRVQSARKSAGLSAQDPAVAWLGGVEEEEKEEKAAAAPLPAPLAAALERQAVLLKAAIGGEWRELRDLPSGTEELIREEHSLPAGRFELVLTRGQ